jgi:uncharacterized protein (TIGR02145 family)
MIRFFSLLFVLCISLGINAQDIVLNFQAIDDQFDIDQIVLTNVTRNETIIIEDPNVPFNFSEVFVGISDEQTRLQSEGMRIYPNPGNGSANVSFSSPAIQDGLIKVLGIDGRVLIDEKISIRNGLNHVKLQIADYGVYVIAIETENSIISKKYLNTSNAGTANQVQSVSYTETSTGDEKSFDAKDGDMVIMEAHSGLHRTIITDQVSGSKTYWFAFFECADMDDNNYAVVQIGNQWWMAENLRTTKYNDGSSIPLIESNSEWLTINDNYNGEGMCWYQNNSSIANTYGGLYSYNAATKNSDPESSQGVCPEGWHIPTEAEFQNLVSYLTNIESELEPATVLKSTSNWVSTENLTNKYGFTAQPSGNRTEVNGTYSGMGEMATWWTSDIVDADNAKSVRIEDQNSDVIAETDNRFSAKSARCVYHGEGEAVLDGYYVVGPAAGELFCEDENRMTIARIEVDINVQVERPELVELFISLKGGAGFNIVGVDESNVVSFGPGSDFQLVMDPVNNEPDIGTFWRGSAQENNERFMVPEDGFYHVVYDKEYNIAVLAKVEWGMIGGAMPFGWAKDTIMNYHGYSCDSAVYSLDSVPLLKNEYRFRYSGGWFIEIDVSDSNFQNHVKIGTSLGGESDSLFNNGPALLNTALGYYDVKLLYNKDVKKFQQTLKWLSMIIFTYDDVDLGLIGDGLIFDGSQWNWNEGWGLHFPEINGNHYTWSWENVEVLTSGAFKLRSGQDWGGYAFGYFDLTIEGDAADDFISDENYSIVPLINQVVNMTFTIDAGTDTKTLMINAAK